MEERNYFNFIENTDAGNVIKTDIENNVSMHAYIIVSNDNFTANMFASFFAYSLICKNKNADLSCSSCIKALSGSNLDFKVYPKNNKTIVVEDIEEIIDSSLVKPIESLNKVFLLKDFSLANLSSQNKLLKILEEPPVNTYFILSVSNTNSVLQTILSRCKIVNVDNFSSEQVYSFLIHNNIENEKAKLISEFSQNNLGTALNLAKLDNYEGIINAVKYLFNNCNSSLDMFETVNYIQPFSDDLNLFFNLVEIHLNKLLQYKTESGLVDESLENIKDKFSYLSINAIEKLIIECKQKVQFNCSSTAIIDMFVLKFLEEKYKWK